MNHTLRLLIAFLLVLSTIGCTSKSLYREAALSGWDNYARDHKKVVPDTEYIEMTESQRKLHMSATKYQARMFEKDQALKLLDLELEEEN